MRLLAFTSREACIEHVVFVESWTSRSKDFVVIRVGSICWFTVGLTMLNFGADSVADLSLKMTSSLLHGILVSLYIEELSLLSLGATGKTPPRAILSWAGMTSWLIPRHPLGIQWIPRQDLN
jgi:hypothetical protein